MNEHKVNTESIYLILSYLILSYLDLSYLICYLIFCYLIYPINLIYILYLNPSYLILSYLVLSHPILSCLILSYLILSYLTFSILIYSHLFSSILIYSHLFSLSFMIFHVFAQQGRSCWHFICGLTTLLPLAINTVASTCSHLLHLVPMQSNGGYVDRTNHCSRVIACPNLQQCDLILCMALFLKNFVPQGPETVT